VRTDQRSSVLVVSQTDKAHNFITGILPPEQFEPVDAVHSAGEAKRLLINKPYDIVVINTPLKDDFGADLAIQITEDYNLGVLMMIKADHYDQVTDHVEDYGILTLSRPCTDHDIFQSLKLLAATRKRLRAMEEKTVRLEQKMKEIRLINRAKGILMERQHMTEAEAHRYLEKAAMDNCVKKADIAQNLIRNADPFAAG